MSVGQHRSEHGAEVSGDRAAHEGGHTDAEVLPGGQRVVCPHLRTECVVVAGGTRGRVVLTLGGRRLGEVATLQNGNQDAHRNDERRQAGPHDLSDAAFPRFHVAVRLAALLGSVKPQCCGNVLHPRVSGSCGRRRWSGWRVRPYIRVRAGGLLY